MGRRFGGGGAKNSTRAEGLADDGKRSSVRWTLYIDCFSERNLEMGGGPGGGGQKIRTGCEGMADDGKRFSVRWTLYSRIASRREILKWEGVQGEGGKQKYRTGPGRGWRMTGSALQCGGRCIRFASRREILKWEGVQGEGGKKSTGPKGSADDGFPVRWTLYSFASRREILTVRTKRFFDGKRFPVRWTLYSGCFSERNLEMGGGPGGGGQKIDPDRRDGGFFPMTVFETKKLP